ncbi:MAG TPA: hypothetical protein VFY90_09690, partial [Tepidiformaceae bacterium]|nr:hypothetical protein [Tepidiformaceae bacterium]
TLRASGDKLTIRFEACYQGACGHNDVIVTININAPSTPCTPSANDTDGDCVDNSTESFYGSDPNNYLSTPEAGGYNSATCSDGKDNDLDGIVDTNDSGCQVFL